MCPPRVQLLGFSAVATATMTTCTTVGVAVGFVMGGAAGDALAVRFPNASRPFINQLSMVLAGPLSVILFKAMPGVLPAIVLFLLVGAALAFMLTIALSQLEHDQVVLGSSQWCAVC